MASQSIQHLSEKDDKAVAIEHSTLESHPDEILSKVFEFLPIIKRVAICRVSKRIEKVAKDVNGNVKALMVLGPKDKTPEWESQDNATFCGINDHKFGKHRVYCTNLTNLLDIVKALPNLKAMDVDLDSFVDSRVDIELFPEMTNIEHIHFSIRTQVSALDFAVRHLQGSKVTCIRDETRRGFQSQATGEQIASLTSLKYLKADGLIDVNHVETLIKMNVISLNALYVSPETTEQFWAIIFENGSALEELGVSLCEVNLRKVIEGRLPRLKKVSFAGDVNDLKNVLRLPNIEDVYWYTLRDKSFTAAQLRDTLRVNGRKMKSFQTQLVDHLDEEVVQIFKVITETCPNLEYLLLYIARGRDLPSKHLLELPLEVLLPRLRYLDIKGLICQPDEMYNLFDRMSSLTVFYGERTKDDPLYRSYHLILERRGRRIMDTISGAELLPPMAQPN